MFRVWGSGFGVQGLGFEKADLKAHAHLCHPPPDRRTRVSSLDKGVGQGIRGSDAGVRGSDDAFCFLQADALFCLPPPERRMLVVIRQGGRSKDKGVGYVIRGSDAGVRGSYDACIPPAGTFSPGPPAT